MIVERRDLVRQQQRIALGPDHDAGVQFQFCRHGGSAGERDLGIHEVGVAPASFAAEENEGRGCFDRDSGVVEFFRQPERRVFRLCYGD